jgi:hypothetical protein
MTLPPATEHSKTGICTLAPRRRRQDVGICRACLDQGLFDELFARMDQEAKDASAG